MVFSSKWKISRHLFDLIWKEEIFVNKVLGMGMIEFSLRSVIEKLQ